MRRGVYPGSFNPPTKAHIAIVEAAVTQRQLDTLTLVVSRRALNKEAAPGPSLEQRVAVIEASVAHLDGVDVAMTDARLIAEIAADFDVVVMGQDKWEQLFDARYYDSIAERDRLLATLPEVALAPRPIGTTALDPPRAAVPNPPHAAVLNIDASLGEVSSTRARTVEPELMTRAALESGWWSSPPVGP